MLRAERLDSGDDDLDLWRVSTGPLELVFLPSVGGRLLSLRADGHELLWVNPAVFDRSFRALTPRSSWPVVDGTFASWTNVGGSKSWPAPQGWGGAGEWAGPPDAVLDSGVYSFDFEVDPSVVRAVVTMVSRPDPRTGLVIRRRFLLEDGARGFEQRLEFLNVSTAPVRWALWEVAQVDTAAAAERLPWDAAVEVEGPADQRIVDLGRYAGDQQVVLVGDRALAPIDAGVAKFGFPEASGAVRFRCAGRPTLTLTTRVEEGAEYPDDGSRVEVWLQSPLDAPIESLSGLQPDAWLAELEVLSPLRRLEPGETAAMTVHWSVDQS